MHKHVHAHVQERFAFTDHDNIRYKEDVSCLASCTNVHFSPQDIIAYIHYYEG